MQRASDVFLCFKRSVLQKWHATRTLARQKIRPWFVATPKPISDPQKTKELVGVVVDVVLAVIFGVVSMPIIWRWCLWLLCFCAFLYVLQSIIYKVSWLPAKTRLVGAALLIFTFVGAFWTTAYGQWEAEKAALTEGDLLGGAKEAFTDKVIRYTPWVSIGNSKTVFQMLPKHKNTPYFRPFPDAQFLVQYGKKGPIISTTIRDYRGDLVATVKDNHWTVYPRFCLDKNYTNNAFEVEDDSGHVVFQVVLLPNGGKPGFNKAEGVEVQGEWWNNQGQGMRILKNPDGDNGVIIPLNPQNQHDDMLITPIFKYPSAEYWGKLRK